MLVLINFNISLHQFHFTTLQFENCPKFLLQYLIISATYIGIPPILYLCWTVFKYNLFYDFSRPLCPVLSNAKHGVINSGSPVCIGQTCPEFKPTSESCTMSQHQKPTPNQLLQNNQNHQNQLLQNNQNHQKRKWSFSSSSSNESSSESSVASESSSTESEDELEESIKVAKIHTTKRRRGHSGKLFK